MFKALMEVQWKWTRVAALLALIVGFTIPVLSVQGLRSIPTGRVQVATVVMSMQPFGVMYTLLAAAVGLAFATIAWAPDHKSRHVYALSLPLSRARYAAYRFGAGSLFLFVPAIGVLIGCFVAIAMFTIPEGLHAYPIALAIRFLLSSFVAFAIFFAVAAGTQRSAAIVLGSIAGLFLLAFVLNAMEVRFNILGHVRTLLFSEMGLLSVFTGRWKLIDV